MPSGGISIGQIRTDYGEFIPLCRELPLILAGGALKLPRTTYTSPGTASLSYVDAGAMAEPRRAAYCRGTATGVRIRRLSDEVRRPHKCSIEGKKCRGTCLTRQTLSILSQPPRTPLLRLSSADAVTRNLVRGKQSLPSWETAFERTFCRSQASCQSHAGHRFTFALIQLAVYETPIQNRRLVIPSVLAQPSCSSAVWCVRQ